MKKRIRLQVSAIRFKQFAKVLSGKNCVDIDAKDNYSSFPEIATGFLIAMQGDFLERICSHCSGNTDAGVAR
jgi:hypothetical protein